MIPPLEILTPDNLSDALSALSLKEYNTGIIAGGTDVVPGLNQGSNRFKDVNLLIDINKVPELKGIEIGKEKISIGAGENFSEILQNKTIEQTLPLLWKSAGTIGSVQVRNRATIAGNFVNNAPCADTVPVLLVYNATVEIESLSSKREVPLNDLLSAPYKTKLNRNEIVTRINIPIPGKNLSGEFYKLGRRRAVAISRITLALLVDLKDNLFNEIRIASGAVTPTGTRFYDLEKFAQGKKADENFIKELSGKLGEKVTEAAGLRWSSEYKLPVIQQVFYQLLMGMERRS